MQLGPSARSRRLSRALRPYPGVSGRVGKGEMVLLERESLNSLFETLEEWERHLAHLDLEGLERDHDKTKI